MTALRYAAMVGNILWMAIVIVGCAGQGTSLAQASLVLYGAIGALNIHALRARQKSLDLVTTAMNLFVFLFCLVSAVVVPAMSARRGSLMLLVVVILSLAAFFSRNHEWMFCRQVWDPPVQRQRTPEKVH